MGGFVGTGVGDAVGVGEGDDVTVSVGAGEAVAGAFVGDWG